jgi:hypothetical protein
MVYEHERKERQPNKHPMCTEWPERSTEDNLSEFGTEYLRSRNLSQRIARMNGWYLSRNAGDEYTRLVIPATTHVLASASTQS